MAATKAMAMINQTTPMSPPPRCGTAPSLTYNSGIFLGSTLTAVNLAQRFILGVGRTVTPCCQW